VDFARNFLGWVCWRISFVFFGFSINAHCLSIITQRKRIFRSILANGIPLLNKIMRRPQDVCIVIGLCEHTDRQIGSQTDSLGRHIDINIGR